MQGVTAVHFGPGRLGLGMVVPALVEAGIDDVMVATGYRPSESVESRETAASIAFNGGYYLRYPPSRSRLQADMLAIRCRTVEPSSLDLSAVSDLIVTLAVGPNVDQSTIAAVEGLCLATRGQGIRVHVLPCENRLNSQYKEFLLRLDRYGCEVRESVADRVCIERDLIQNKVVITTEPFWSWIVETSRSAHDALPAFLGASRTEGRGIAFLPQLSAYRRRKAYLVNGSHAALALKLLSQNPPISWTTLDEFVNDCEGIRELLERMHVAYISTLVEEFPDVFDEVGLRRYSRALIERLASEPDSALRIVNRLTPNDYKDFIISYAERVHIPMHRVDPHLAEELVQDFYDVCKRRDLGLSLFVDYILQLANTTEDGG